MFKRRKSSSQRAGNGHPERLANDPATVAAITYQLAYSVIPTCIYGEISADDVDKCLTFDAWGGFLYYQHCQALGLTPDREVALQHLTHHGTLANGCRYAVIEYPEPKATYEESGVLAPYFSGIVQQPDGAIEYFVLGQNPIRGLTFRSVTWDGTTLTNCNLGRGPEPGLQNFLDHITHYLARREPA
ncbi:MAG: hypothetical protein ACR2NP_11355 [Pirellulaceae bacterium]